MDNEWGHVLLVDDEEEIRNLLREILADAGYEVVCAAQAIEAMEHIGSGEPVDLLLTDLKMPGMNGLELATWVKARRPEVCILLMSGYSHEYRIDPSRDDFIAKPFRSRELLGCVMELLGRQAAGR
jgi:DNA-binding response OmpR family regulator